MLGLFGKSLEIFLQLPRRKSELRHRGEILKFEILRRYVEKHGFFVGLLFFPDPRSFPWNGILVLSATRLPLGLSFQSAPPQWVIPFYPIQGFEDEPELPTTYPSWQANVINLSHGSELEGSLPLLDTIDMARNAMYLLRCHPASHHPPIASSSVDRPFCTMADSHSVSPSA